MGRRSDNVEQAIRETDPRFGDVQVTRNLSSQSVTSVFLLERSEQCVAAFGRALARSMKWGASTQEEPAVTCQDDARRAAFKEIMEKEGFHIREIFQPLSLLQGSPTTALIAEREYRGLTVPSGSPSHMPSPFR